MANVQHSSMTGSDLHEPKGVASASTNQVYVSNGSGSGTWQKIGVSQIDTSSIKNANKEFLNLFLDDIGVAGSHYIVSPIDATITKAYSVIGTTLAGSNTLIQLAINGVDVTNGLITITSSGSAAGDVDSCTPTGNNTVTAGQAIKVTTDGGTSTAGAHAMITIELGYT